jgi:hypothetical protein
MEQSAGKIHQAGLKSRLERATSTKNREYTLATLEKKKSTNGSCSLSYQRKQDKDLNS